MQLFLWRLLSADRTASSSLRFLIKTMPMTDTPLAPLPDLNMTNAFVGQRPKGSELRRADLRHLAKIVRRSNPGRAT
ncbi:hypothetical protein CFAM422_007833 [Trichoderma lentiforme]|uniref:Uncharacterized protein n=1 Tax=Trichoderma lentiforme TaxID=1567552 RepID=A0A9P4XE07_9HYPO|nr:hypothetical protein CFAM422_007833 [Trichoderma lentiforme]